MNQIIPIFFASDDNYIPFLIVTLESIVSNAKSNSEYHFYILNNGLKQESIDKVMEYNYNNFKVEFINVAEKMEQVGNALHTRDYYSKSTYFRLFIPTMFPQYSKALYLDCDICVLGDIADLYNKNIGNNLVGAIADESVQIVPEFKLYTDNYLGVNSKNYFNAGILIMNLDELRKMQFEQKFINLLTSYKFEVAQDQDYLNVICKDRVYYIDKSWNKMPFKDDTIDVSEINLIHYNLSFKPWHYSGIIYEDKFWYYANSAGYLEEILFIKSLFTDDKKEKDAAGGKRLIDMAQKKGSQKDPFKKLLETGEIDPVNFTRNEIYTPEKIIGKIFNKNKSKETKKCEN